MTIPPRSSIGCSGNNDDAAIRDHRVSGELNLCSIQDIAIGAQMPHLYEPLAVGLASCRTVLRGKRYVLQRRSSVPSPMTSIGFVTTSLKAPSGQGRFVPIWSAVCVPTRTSLHPRRGGAAVSRIARRRLV